MRRWAMAVIVAAGAALTQSYAPSANLWSAQAEQTKPTAQQRSAKPSAPSVPKAGATTGQVRTTAAKATPAKSGAATSLAPSRTGALAAPSKNEQAIFDSANRERAARKLPPLKWNAGLASAARAHAQKMAQAGTISHQFSGEMDMGMRIRVAGVRFTSAAENVAQGPSAAVLHQEWMDSPAHRDNILDP